MKATDPAMLAICSPVGMAIFVTAALVAALPAVIRAVRIDPVTMLRSEWEPGWERRAPPRLMSKGAF